MHNTGNPLGSTQVLDLYDNSEAIDQYVNSQEDSFPDRFGTKRLTLAGLIKRSMALRNEINDFSGALTFKPEWSDVPMNVSEGVGGEGGALNLQAEALGNRSEINKVTSREALRRSYAEAGYTLVTGSFEQGGTLNNQNDVLLQERTGKAFSGPAGTVAAGTNPASGGFVDKSGVATSASAISNANGGSVQDFIDESSNVEERLLGVGAKIYRGSNGQYVQNGDVVPAETTHLRVLVGGEPYIVAMSPVASGVVSLLTDDGVTIGATVVYFNQTKKIEYFSNDERSAIQNMVAGYPVASKTGDVVSSGSGVWERISELNGDISDFYLISEATIIDFGGKNGRLVDSTTALQENLDARVNVKLTQGEFSVTGVTTPSSPNNEGFSIKGTGCARTDPLLDARSETASTIIYNGVANGTLLQSDSTLGLVLEDLTLHGNGLAGILYHVTYTNQGAGVCTTRNVAFYGGGSRDGVGVQCAELPGDGTCADMFFETVGFINLDVGFLVKNSQGLNYNFHNLSASDCNSAIRLEQGNSVSAFTTNLVGTGLDDTYYSIEILASDDSAYKSVFNNLRMEQGCDNLFKGVGKGVTEFNGITEAQTAHTNRMIDIAGHTCVLKNGRLASSNIAKLRNNGGIPSMLLIDNIYFDFAWTDLKDILDYDTNNKLYVALENCSHGTRKLQIPNTYTSVLLGPTVYTCQTVDTNNKIAYLFGETNQNQYNTIECSEGITQVDISVTGYDGSDFYAATATAMVKSLSRVVTILGYEILSQSVNFPGLSFLTSIIGCRVEIFGTAAKTIDYSVVATARLINI